MIEKVESELQVICDTCDQVEYGGTLEFKDFVDWLKQQGWRPYKEEGEWRHRCPECANDRS